jgi:hypothetical protein
MTYVGGYGQRLDAGRRLLHGHGCGRQLHNDERFRAGRDRRFLSRHANKGFIVGSTSERPCGYPTGNYIFGTEPAEGIGCDVSGGIVPVAGAGNGAIVTDTKAVDELSRLAIQRPGRCSRTAWVRRVSGYARFPAVLVLHGDITEQSSLCVERALHAMGKLVVVGEVS